MGGPAGGLRRAGGAGGGAGRSASPAAGRSGGRPRTAGGEGVGPAGWHALAGDCGKGLGHWAKGRWFCPLLSIHRSWLDQFEGEPVILSVQFSGWKSNYVLTRPSSPKPGIDFDGRSHGLCRRARASRACHQTFGSWPWRSLGTGCHLSSPRSSPHTYFPT